MAWWEPILGLTIGVGVIIGLKLLIFYQWHRNGMRWPGEDWETYVEFSPRFERREVDGEEYWHDTRTGLTAEQLRSLWSRPGDPNGGGAS